MNSRPPVLVLGIGNELFTDEGLGIAAAHRIAELNLAGVQVLDGGTLGIALLPEIADREALLVLDAVAAKGAEPGTVLVLRDDEVTRAHSLMVSVHQLGIADALASAELSGCRPDRLTAVGMVPADLDTGYGLSPLVESRLDSLVSQALAVLADWGVEVPAHA